MDRWTGPHTVHIGHVWGGRGRVERRRAAWRVAWRAASALSPLRARVLRRRHPASAACRRGGDLVHRCGPFRTFARTGRTCFRGLRPKTRHPRPRRPNFKIRQHSPWGAPPKEVWWTPRHPRALFRNPTGACRWACPKANDPTSNNPQWAHGVPRWRARRQTIHQGKRSVRPPPRRAGGVPEGKRSASKQSVGARGVPVGVPEGKQSHRQAIRVVPRVHGASRWDLQVVELNQGIAC